MVIGWLYVTQPFSWVWGHFGGIWALFGLFWPLFGPISASKGPFLAIFSRNVAADRRHPGVGGPNLVGRTALGRGNFGLSLGPQAIGDLRYRMKPTCLLLVAVGPFWAHFGLQGAIFGHFLAVMWPPTGATRELGAQTWWVGAP